ncbi:alpha/beta hydrolase [Actinoplanes sp. NPDC023936]|uniref:alpha/beta fold hydrolase n=1 Tax=Actinoplanes sp. NPDC023936 TaxID=3154910 RepID=UPI00340BA356
MSAEIFFDVDGGSLAAVDHGGAGRPVLLVHGTGHNAAAWAPVAERLTPDHRVVAVDLRGHGHSTAGSVTAEQYWRDLAVVVAALGWERPLLVGHSTGGYAVTALAAAGLVEPAGICVVDGLVLDDREASTRTLEGTRTPQMAAQLRQAFGYGLRLDAGQRDAWIGEQVAVTPTDWLNAGSDPELVRAVATRAFGEPDGAGLFLRRPAIEEVMMTTTAAPDAAVFPSVDVYERVACPMTIILPGQGFYADRRDEVAAIVAAAPGRRLVDMPGGHNVVMTHPEELAAAIR